MTQKNYINKHRLLINIKHYGRNCFLNFFRELTLRPLYNILLVAGAVIAFSTLWATRSQGIQLAKQVKIQLNETRPFLIFNISDMSLVKQSGGTFLLCYQLKNTGRRIAFSPHIKWYMSEPASKGNLIKKILDDVQQDIAPEEPFLSCMNLNKVLENNPMPDLPSFLTEKDMILKFEYTDKDSDDPMLKRELCMTIHGIQELQTATSEQSEGTIVYSMTIEKPKHKECEEMLKRVDENYLETYQ